MSQGFNHSDLLIGLGDWHLKHFSHTVCVEFSLCVICFVSFTNILSFTVFSSFYNTVTIHNWGQSATIHLPQSFHDSQPWMFCWYSLEIYAANPSRISLLFALYHSRWHTGRFRNQVGYQSFKPQRSFNSLVFMHWFIYSYNSMNRHFLNPLHIDIPVTMNEDASKIVCESFRCHYHLYGDCTSVTANDQSSMSWSR